jgi:outer membrane protein assembly factor BamE (lipoprotein component of BamABCDE complex)
MLREMRTDIRKLAVVACTLFLVACAGTDEQAGYRQLTGGDATKVTQGMTRQEVEQALGRPQRGMTRDRQGNEVLQYLYAVPGSSYKGCLCVTIDSASGKVTQVTTQTW